jgi:hypothetical protein
MSKSWKRNSCSRPAPPPAPGRGAPDGRGPLRAPPPKPPNAPSRRMSSYCFRFSASPNTV